MPWARKGNLPSRNENSTNYPQSCESYRQESITAITKSEYQQPQAIKTIEITEEDSLLIEGRVAIRRNQRILKKYEYRVWKSVKRREDRQQAPEEQSGDCFSS